MEGFRICVNQEPEANHRVIQCYDIPFLASRGLIDLRIALDDIVDRSKADSFSKALACLQSLWLVIQCIARHAQGLPITELQLTTTAFVFASVVSYALMWHAPFDVHTRIIISMTQEQYNDLLAYRNRGFKEEGDRRDEASSGITSWLASSSNQELITWSAMAVLAVVFGGIHCAAWNFYFPSHVTRTMWRVCSVIITAAAPINCIIYILVNKTGEPPFLQALWFIAAATYVSARLILVILTFLCLRSLPPLYHQGIRWIAYIPHI
jgi:hypothetical protein